MMVKTIGSWLPEDRSLWESNTFKNCIFTPAEYNTCGFLPATTNLHNISNLDLSRSGLSGFPRGGLAYEANDLIRSWVPPLTQSEYFREQISLFQARVDVLTSTNEAPSTQQKKFLIFDQSENETRLIRTTSLFPQNAAESRYSHQPSKSERVCNEKCVIPEASGETETVDEGSEMREDSEEINALLYSDDDDFGNDFDGESEDDDDDEVSTGHSPSVNQEHDFDDVACFDRPTKRQKTLDDGGHSEPPFLSGTSKKNRNPLSETINGGELVGSFNEGSSPTIGSKRVRKGEIRDTLRVLEGIVPGLKGKDPVTVLDEAINYLKMLKSNAITMSMEDQDESSCYGPSN